MSGKLASVIIPTKDKLTRLRLVLQGLEPQINDVIEVIIILDGCNKETIEGVKKLRLSFLPEIIISEKNIGRSAARNRGIRHANGEIIIFLDDDRIPDRNFIQKHITGHKKHHVLIGERKQLYFSEEFIEKICSGNLVKNNFDYIIKKSRSEYANRIREFFFLNNNHPLRWFLFVTGNVSLKKSDLEKVGLFDENFSGWGYEDTDLGYRLAKAGINFSKDSSIINYHLSHENNRIQKSQEERRNLEYFSDKFKEDWTLQNMLRLMKLKSKLTPYI